MMIANYPKSHSGTVRIISGGKFFENLNKGKNPCLFSLWQLRPVGYRAVT